MELHLTNDETANRLFSDSPFALLLGMLLDQQVPMERAFASPATLEARLGAPLEAADVTLPTAC